jgi:IclR family KDG regulon transcriptional repressor
VGDVTRDLHIPQPSVSMLLGNLADLGYLEYDRKSRTYAPTIRVALLAGWIGRRFNSASTLASSLEELHEVLGEEVYVGIQNGASAQYVQRCGADISNVDSKQLRSLTCSAMGRALLSAKDDAEIVRWVRRCNAEATEERYKISESAFMTLIADVRRVGYAETRGCLTPGSTGIAVYVPSLMGRHPLAIGCGGPTERMEEKRPLIIETLRTFQADWLGQPLARAS